MEYTLDTIIIYTMPAGTTHIVHPSQLGLEQGMDVIIERSVPKEATSYRIAHRDDLPKDREFRDAWTDKFDTPTVDIDLDKAKIIHLDRLRAERDDKLKELDVEVIKALGQKDDKQLQILENEKEMLRTIPERFQTIDIQTVDQLKSIKLDNLL